MDKMNNTDKNNTVQLISFHVIPRPESLEEAEQRLRRAGFEQINRSYDGKRLQVLAPRNLVERVFGFPLVEKRRQSRVRTVERVVVDMELPEGAVLPKILQDVVDEIVFPTTPDYLRSSFT